MEEYVPSESVKFTTTRESVFNVDKKEEKFTRIEIEEEEEKEMLSNDPGVYTIKDYVTAEECEHMIKLAQPTLERSVVSDDKGGYQSAGRTSRTSWIDHFHDEVTTKLANKIAKTVGIPIVNAEKFQVVHYNETNEYRAHYDSWDNDGSEKSYRCVKYGGPRILTALVYLNKVEAGGATRFTKLNKNVEPELGKLLVFENVHKNTINKHYYSEHAGMPVLKGEKYIFNLWFREKSRKILYKEVNPDYYKVHSKVEVKEKEDNLIKAVEIEHYDDVGDLKKIHNEKNIYKYEGFMNKEEREELLRSCEFAKSRFPSAWIRNIEKPKFAAKIASALRIEPRFLENMNIIKYGVGQNHGPFYDAYDIESDTGKKYTARLGQRLQTITIVLKNEVNYRFNNLEMGYELSEGDLMLYDNVENTNQRDSNMIHTIRNMTKGESVIMNVYVRECDSNGVRSKNKGVFNVDIDENIKMIKKEKEQPKVEELEDPYETFKSVLAAFEKGEVTKFWGGIKSFKYSFRGDFDYLKECVLKHIELKKAGKGLTKEVMDKEYVFDEFNPVVTENVVSKEMIELYQEYYRKTIADGVWGLGDRQANRYKQNNEPFSRFLHYEILPLIEKITGKKLRPTYTYLSSYVNDADLPAHTDRPDCEFTVSFLVNKDHDWPIYAHKVKQPVKNKGRYDITPPKSECFSLDCENNGFIIFCGTDHIHFRENFKGTFYDILLLHYRII